MRPEITSEACTCTGTNAVDDDDLRIATESGWEYRGKTLATIGDLADAWAAAHKEGA